MVAALIFVLGFVVLGISVVLLAFRSGPRRRREPGRPAQSRASRRLVAIGVTLIIVGLGVAIPLLITVLNSRHHSREAVGGVTLTADQAEGRAMFAKYCSTCHTLRAANAVGKVGPNLDALHPPKPVILNAISQGRAQGRGQMPAGLVDGADAQNVAAFVAAVAGHQ
jgi:cytochrome c551